MADTSRDDSAVHFSMATVAAAAGWTTRRTRKRFVRNGWATKIGGRWGVTATTLRTHFPALADRMESALSAERETHTCSPGLGT